MLLLKKQVSKRSQLQDRFPKEPGQLHPIASKAILLTSLGSPTTPALDVEVPVGRLPGLSDSLGKLRYKDRNRHILQKVEQMKTEG